MRTFPLALLSIVIGTALPACGGDGPGNVTGSTCPTPQTLTYANFGQMFMQQHCLACHASGGPE